MAPRVSEIPGSNSGAVGGIDENEELSVSCARAGDMIPLFEAATNFYCCKNPACRECESREECQPSAYCDGSLSQH